MTLNHKVGYSRPHMIRACCLSVRQHYKKNIYMQWLSRGTPAVLRDERNSSYVDPFTWEQTVLIIYLSTFPIEAFLIPLNFFLCHIYPQFFYFTWKTFEINRKVVFCLEPWFYFNEQSSSINSLFG